ncbi:RNA ligase [Providencia phage PSTCR6]|nr:RNA ligase [Providencia phage PSTCR6]
MFVKYSSIENIENSKMVDKVQYEGFSHPSVKWIAQEKIHGTNFSFICDGKTVVCAKRTGLIGETESFFGYELILDRYKAQILKMFELVKDSMPDLETLTVFGEFAGPGIQRQVDYQEKDFWVFDILINGQLVDSLFMRMMASNVGLKIAPVLSVGEFETLANMERAFDSLIPEFNAFCEENGVSMANAVVWGPQPKGKDNIAEGFVIKTVIPAELPNGKRVIFKCKNESFKEKGKTKPVKIVPELSGADQAFVFSSTQYITDQRLSNVLSHIGELSAKDFGKVMGLMTQDIFKDMLVDGLDPLDCDNPALVKKSVQSEVTAFLREKWKGLL